MLAMKHPSTALYAVQARENIGIQQERTCFRHIRIPQTELLKLLIAQIETGKPTVEPVRPLLLADRHNNNAIRTSGERNTRCFMDGNMPTESKNHDTQATSNAPSFDQQIAAAQEWFANPRFAGIVRLHTAQQVAEQQGTIPADYPVARQPRRASMRGCASFSASASRSRPSAPTRPARR